MDMSTFINGPRVISFARKPVPEIVYSGEDARINDEHDLSELNLRELRHFARYRAPGEIEKLFTLRRKQLGVDVVEAEIYIDASFVTPFYKLKDAWDSERALIKDDEELVIDVIVHNNEFADFSDHSTLVTVAGHFPCTVPVRWFEDKKEGDVIEVTICGCPMKLTLRQNGHYLHNTIEAALADALD